MIRFNHRFLLVIILMILLSSCNYRAIEDMPMVAGLAIDPSKEGYTLTAKVIIPSGGTATDQSDQIFIQATGETIFEAARDFIMKEGQKVFWGQLEFVIINQQIAKDDVAKVLDFFTRDDEIREDIDLLISGEGYKAEEIILASKSEGRLQFYITEALENVDSTAKYHPVTMAEFNNIFINKGSEPMLPRIYIEDTLGEKRIIINGGIVFKDNKAVGELSGQETQQYRIIYGEKGIGLLIIDYKTNDEESDICLEIDSSKSKINIEAEDHEYTINVDVTITAVIGEITNSQIDLLDISNIEKFKEQAEEQIKKELEDFIYKIQKEYESDIFGFGEKFREKYPKTFKTFEEDWNGIFSSLSINVSVKMEVIGSALYIQPLKEDK